MPTRQQIEKAHHKAFVTFLRASEGQLSQLAYIKHTPNEALGGGPTVAKRDPRTGKVRQVPLSVLQGGQLGVRAGVWDFEYLGPNVVPMHGFKARTFAGFAIEFKAPGGALSPEQEKWMEHYDHNNWRCEVFTNWVYAARFAIQWVGGDLNRFLFT